MNMTGKCRKWCAWNNFDWSKKCNWKNCKACPECAADTTTKTTTMTTADVKTTTQTTTPTETATTTITATTTQTAVVKPPGTEYPLVGCTKNSGMTVNNVGNLAT